MDKGFDSKMVFWEPLRKLDSKCVSEAGKLRTFVTELLNLIDFELK